MLSLLQCINEKTHFTWLMFSETGFWHQHLQYTTLGLDASNSSTSTSMYSYHPAALTPTGIEGRMKVSTAFGV